MNAIRKNSNNNKNITIFLNKNRPVTRMSHTMKTIFSNPNERSLWNSPTVSSISCPQEPQEKQSRHNRMAFVEYNTGVTKLRLTATITFLLHLNYLYSSLVQQHKNREQHLEIHLISCSEIKGLAILPIIFLETCPCLQSLMAITAGSFQSYCMKRMLKAITIQHTAT